MSLRHSSRTRSRPDVTEAPAALAAGAFFDRGASLGPAYCPYLPAASASAEELIAAIGLEPRHTYSGRHLEPLQDLSRSRVDSPQIALVAFPSAVPELS